jgi:hypothetical protein
VDEKLKQSPVMERSSCDSLSYEEDSTHDPVGFCATLDVLNMNDDVFADVMVAREAINIVSVTETS